MSNANWKRIWEGKRADVAAAAQGEDETLDRLLRLNGYCTPTAIVTPATWTAYVGRIAEKIGARAGDRLFEVGCGSGAFLYPFRRLGCVTDGVDYAPGLVDAARAALPGSKIDLGEAADIDPHERYDLVVSSGVFLYFSDLAYAERVLGRMMEKATRGVAVLDVSDAARREEAIALRRQSYAEGEYDRAYAGLPHLYIERSWFEAFAAAQGLSCRIEPQSLPNYVSSEYRYNVFLARP